MFQTTNRSHLRHVFVHLLNGEKLDVTCEHSTPGKDLYDAVVAHLGLPEHYLFGITYAQGKLLLSRENISYYRMMHLILINYKIRQNI